MSWKGEKEPAVWRTGGGKVFLKEKVAPEVVWRWERGCGIAGAQKKVEPIPRGERDR